MGNTNDRNAGSVVAGFVYQIYYFLYRLLTMGVDETVSLEKFEDVEVVYPMHMNPAVREVANEILGGLDRVKLIEPVNADELHNAIKRGYLVLTDSGGLQEEAPSLGKPVLVLRNETERPEAVDAGTVKIAGVDKDTIVNMASELLSDETAYNKMAKAVNPYGDGFASERIVKAIIEKFEQ